MTPAPAVIFVGPSLAGAPVTLPPGVVLAPPAEAGDLYRAARGGVRVIGLIDGTFGDRPTVWHKEILWALAAGVRVYGAASLGALRAAECAPFGMTGVGAIFERCRSGALEDDHEVALAYAPRELDYTPLSEPLVNVRATVDAAVAAGILAEPHAADLLAAATAMPFRDVTWRRLAAALPPAARTAFEAWLPAGRVDLKRADALALLDAVAQAVGLSGPASAPAFAFADTRYWRAAVAAFERGGLATDPEDRGVLDELRLDPARYERALVRAYARHAAAATPLSDDDPADRLADLRLDLGLDTAAAFRAWRASVRAAEPALAAALAAEERLVTALEAEAANLEPALLDALRIDGRFERLDRRAADKRARLAGHPEPAFVETELPGLVAGLCARARVRIDSDDPDVVARSLGLADRRALHRLLAREEAYRAAGGEDG